MRAGPLSERVAASDAAVAVFHGAHVVGILLVPTDHGPLPF